MTIINKPEDTTDYQSLMEQKFKRQRRGDRLVRNVIFTFVFFLVAVVLVGIWKSTSREPVVLNYCGIDHSAKPGQHKCINYKLKIPFIYYGGYLLDFSVKEPGKVQELEVAYPSMQPWNSLSLHEKWKFQKLKIDIYDTSTQTVKEIVELSSLGRKGGVQPTIRSQELIYGLTQFLDEPEPHMWQFLVPPDSEPQIYLRCAYRTTNSDVNKLGCGDYMFTTWGLKIEAQHKLILLPHWSDIHNKVQILIQSFVVNP